MRRTVRGVITENVYTFVLITCIFLLSWALLLSPSSLYYFLFLPSPHSSFHLLLSSSSPPTSLNSLYSFSSSPSPTPPYPLLSSSSPPTTLNSLYSFSSSLSLPLQLLPILMESLDRGEAELKVSTLEGLMAVTEDAPTIITSHVPTLIPKLLELAKCPDTMVRPLGLYRYTCHKT